MRGPRTPRITAEKSRRLVRAGLVALALVAFVLLPGYLASRPQFFGRYDKLEGHFGPWSTSSHVKASCEDCHVAPRTVTRTVYRVRMLGEFYASLAFSGSRMPKVFSAPTNEACLACHDDLRSVSPKGDLLIPHKAHVNILKMDCVACHNYLVHETSPEGKHTPPMAGCLDQCHDGDTAKNACTACHTEKAAPASHRGRDWTVVHADEAEDDGDACNSCHRWTENYCADCHSKRPKSHTSRWRAVHGDAVEKHRSCEACHEGDFCERCHGEVPQLNFNPAIELVQ